MNKIKKLGAICALVAATSMPSGCATVVGAVSGSVTLPAYTYQTARDEGSGLAASVLFATMAVPMGPIFGAVYGFRADVDIVYENKYLKNYDPFRPWKPHIGHKDF